MILLDRFGVPLLGTIEPIPGVRPTGRQIRALTAELKGGRGVIIHGPYQSPRAVELFAALVLAILSAGQPWLNGRLLRALLLHVVVFNLP